MAVTQFSFDVRVIAPPHTKLKKFFEELEKGRILGTKCRRCGKLYFPPQADCSKCLSDEMDWVEIKGVGELLTYTVTYVAPKAYTNIAPYTIGVARLDEGPKVTAWVKDVKPEEVKVGMRVKLVVEKFEDGVARYVLKPEKN